MDPFAQHWGFTVRPVIAIEMGRHLKSTSPQVEHHDLSRVRGELKVIVEYENFSLTLAGVTRHLFSDEVLLGESGSVLTIDRSDRGFLRGDFLWDFGIAGLTISHINGRQPPAFTQAHTTSLGIAIKW